MTTQGTAGSTDRHFVGVSCCPPVSKEASAVFWHAFGDELTKVSAKSPVGLKVPKPGTNLVGMTRVQLTPGKTPITAPGQSNASVASTSGVGHSFPLGRTGTSANPAPGPIYSSSST